MKKYHSVFSLFVRSSFYRVLPVLLLMTVGEICAFSWNFQQAAALYHANPQAGFPLVERLLTSSGIYWWFAGALVLISAVISLPGCEFHEKTGYTLMRLQITQQEIFLVQAAYDTAVYLMLFFVQILVCFGLSQSYTLWAPAGFASNQTVFLAFYRSPFLHCLLPLEEVWLWIRNIILIIALGTSAAYVPYLQRKKKFPVSLIFLIVVTVFFFAGRASHIGNLFGTVCMILACICVTVNVFVTVYQKEERGDE